MTSYNESPSGELTKNTQIIFFKIEGDLRHLRWNEKSAVIHKVSLENILFLESKKLLKKEWDAGTNLKEFLITEAKTIWQQSK